MKARVHSVLGLLSFLFWLATGTGCSLTQPQADPTRFYVLSSSAGGPTAIPAAGAPAVHLRPIEVANYIRARPLIVRKGDNEVEFREFARWGEPLEQGMARIVREELLGRGAASAVAISGVRAANRPYDYELAIRVLACEGTAAGEVNFRAIWELSAAGPQTTPAIARGDYRPTDLKWDTTSEASLAAQLSRAVVGLAGEIAAGLPKK